MATRHWLTAERVRVYPRIFLVLFVLGAGIYPLTFHGMLDPSGHPLGSDFITFWSAGQLALQGQAASAYDLLVLAGVQQQLAPGLEGGFGWFYPPTFLLVVAPLALLPYPVAYLLFVLVSAGIFVLTLGRALPPGVSKVPLLAFPGLWVCAAHGQNGLLTAALAGGALLLLSRRQGAGGALIGVLAVKPHLAVLFPLMLAARRQWRALLTAGLVAAALLAGSVAVLGPATLQGWAASSNLARLAVEAGALPWVKMPSTFAALLAWGVPVPLAYAGHSVVTLGAISGCWWLWRRTASAELAGAALMTATFLVNPYSFDYDLAWLGFPIAWLAGVGLASGWRRGDREVLVASWLLPLLLASVGSYLHLPLGPPVLVALLWCLIRRGIPAKPGINGREATG